MAQKTPQEVLESCFNNLDLFELDSTFLYGSRDDISETLTNDSSNVRVDEETGECCALPNQNHCDDNKNNAASDELSEDGSVNKNSTDNDDAPADNVHSLQNPFVAVERLCHILKMKMPQYNVVKSVHFPNAKQIFKIECLVETYKTIGSGTSKKLAKKDAAIKMYHELFSIPKNDNNEPLSSPEVLPNERPVNVPEELPANDDLYYKENTKLLFPKTKQDFKLYYDRLNFNKDERSNKRNNLMTLQKLKINSVKVLDEIGEKEGFTANYYTIRQKPDQVEVLIELTTTPIIHKKAVGRNIKKARESAAYDVMMWFKPLL